MSLVDWLMTWLFEWDPSAWTPADETYGAWLGRETALGRRRG